MRLAELGLLIAYPAFALTFRGPRYRFWGRMTTAGAILGTVAMAGDRSLRTPRLRPRDVAIGVGVAAGLYGVFQVGDRLARRVLPSGDKNIEEIYELRELESNGEIGLRLAAVIGPAEELFWRGLLQRSAASRWGPGRGAVVSAAAYGGAHLVTANPALIGAATVAGLYWSLLASLGMPMAALIVSHVVWDIYIFLVAPILPAANADGRLRRS
ncbi:MAG: CPBP family intramembrane metalloprotease [Chloroflexota bacterium]|nr:CPBP family intramembrane metalloprotease [Chloroflexota bacterium]